MKTCRICLRFHNHLNCPYCGTIELHNACYSIHNRKVIPVARAIPTPREYKLAVGKKVIERVYHRLVRGL